MATDFEALWKILGNTGDRPAGWFGPGGDANTTPMQAQFNSFRQPMYEEIDKYVGELISESKGDYDFVARQIEQAYQKAAGSNDMQTKEFLKSVANKLEESQGRLVYDYNTQKYRAEKSRNTVLSRLSEDEMTWKQKNDKTVTRENQSLAEQNNARGILTSKSGTGTGLQGLTERELANEQGNRLSALERSVSREREDLNTNTGYQLDDMKTGVRRSLLDAGDTRTSTLEQAERARKKAEDEAKRIGYLSKQQANKYADEYSRGGL